MMDKNIDNASHPCLRLRPVRCSACFRPKTTTCSSYCSRHSRPISYACCHKRRTLGQELPRLASRSPVTVFTGSSHGGRGCSARAAPSAQPCLGVHASSRVHAVHVLHHQVTSRSVALTAALPASSSAAAVPRTHPLWRACNANVQRSM